MEILGITLLVLLGGITIIALFTTITLLFPAQVKKTQLTLENGLGRSLLLGVVNFTFFAVLVAALVWLAQESSEVLGGILVFLAVVIMLGFVIFALVGLAALAKVLGHRIGGGKTPFVTNLRGSALLLLAGLAPYVGWFLFTPLVLLTGLGAAISALVRKGDVVIAAEEVESV